MAGVISCEAAKVGAQVAWVAPTYSNSRPMWRFVEQVAGQSPGVVIRRSEREIIMPSTGRVGVYTAENPVGLRGENFDIVICDEAAQYPPEVWTDVLIPTLADRNGMAYLISTPKGKNWFFYEYMRGLADGKNQASFTAPTAANPMPQIQEAAKRARDRVSERTYRQEWLAEFVMDGALFVNVEACATATRKPAHEKGEYVIGVDWARAAGGDNTVFVVLDAQTRSMVEMVKINGAAYDNQLNRLRELWRAYNECQIIAEGNSMGGPLIERLQMDGLPVYGFVTMSASKHALISALELAFDRREIGVLNDPELLVELNAYEKKERSGIPAYGAPPGMHDDMVIALALAWHGVGSGASWYVS